MNGCCSSRFRECEQIASMRNSESARLLTRCVACETISPVTIEALSTQAGLIHCKDCGIMFNATWNLVDEAPNPVCSASPAAPTANPNTFVEADTQRESPGFAEGEHLFTLDDELLADLALSGDEHEGLAEIRRTLAPETGIERPVEERSSKAVAISATPRQVSEIGGRFSMQPDRNRRHEPKLGHPGPAPEHPSSVRAQLPGTGGRVVTHPVEPRSKKLWIWLIGSLFMAGVLFVQVRFLLLDELAGIASARPYLSVFCSTLGCTVPAPFSGPVFRVEETKVDLHPDIPGAVIVKIGLLNRSTKDKSYPGIELTLSDRNGRVVGRRNYLPSAFLESQMENLVPAGGRTVITLNLAQPEDNAVGFEARIIGKW